MFRYLTCLSTVFICVTCVHAATINIGTFTSSQMVAAGPGSGSNPLTKSDSTANNAPEAMGGQREFVVRRSSGTGRVQLDIDFTMIGALSFTSSGDAVGRGLVTWDGPGTTVSTFDPKSSNAAIARGEPDTFGLTGSGTTGGVDLTDHGTNNAITIDADADNVGLPIIFHFYRSAGVYATGTLQVPGDASYELKNLQLKFTDFTAVGASVMDIFQDVKAITMQIDGRNASDATVDNFEATYVPEPSTLMLVPAALGLIAIVKRRK